MANNPKIVIFLENCDKVSLLRQVDNKTDPILRPRFVLALSGLNSRTLHWQLSTYLVDAVFLETVKKKMNIRCTVLFIFDYTSEGILSVRRRFMLLGSLQIGLEPKCVVLLFRRGDCIRPLMYSWHVLFSLNCGLKARLF